MTGGKYLDEMVVKCLENDFKIKLNRSTIQINSKCPIFESSPNAVGDEYLLDVKNGQYTETITDYWSDISHNPIQELMTSNLSSDRYFCLASFG